MGVNGKSMGGNVLYGRVDSVRGVRLDVNACHKTNIEPVCLLFDDPQTIG